MILGCLSLVCWMEVGWVSQLRHRPNCHPTRTSPFHPPTQLTPDAVAQHSAAGVVGGDAPHRRPASPSRLAAAVRMRPGLSATSIANLSNPFVSNCPSRVIDLRSPGFAAVSAEQSDVIHAKLYDLPKILKVSEGDGGVTMIDFVCLKLVRFEGNC